MDNKKRTINIHVVWSEHLRIHNPYNIHNNASKTYILKLEIKKKNEI